MSIQLNSTSGGSVSLDPVSSLASDITLTLPDSVGTAGQYLRNSGTAGTLEFANGGKILQVKQTVVTSKSSYDTGQYRDTPLTVTITPTQSNSNMLVTVDASLASSIGYGIRSQLTRGSTAIYLGDDDTSLTNQPLGSKMYVGSYTGVGSYNMFTQHYCFLDEDRTAGLSNVTYTLQVDGYTAPNKVYLNRTHGQLDTAAYDMTTASSITVMEVAA